MTAIAAFALSNWRWLIPSLIALAFAVTLGIARVEISDLKAAAATTALEIEQTKTAAEAAVAASEKKAREVEARNAELAQQKDKEHNDAQNEIAARDHQLASLVAANGGLRIAAASCGPRGDGMPGPGATPGVPPESPAGVECRLPATLSGQIRGDYSDAASVTAFARLCAAWAVAAHGKTTP